MRSKAIRYHTKHELLALRDEAGIAINRLADVNPFLADFLKGIAVDRHNMYHPGYYGVIAVIDIFWRTGLDRVLTSPKAVDETPEAFWKLMDEAKRQDNSKVVPRAVEGLWRLYCNFDRRGFLGEAFGSDPRSPKEVLKSNAFHQFLKETFTCSEDTYRLTYANNRHPQFLIIKYSNRDLLTMVTDAFSRCLNKFNRLSRSLDTVYDVEKWFGEEAASIHDYRDLDERKLVTAINNVKKMYEGNLRRERMLFLFHLYSIQMLDHPEHRFFAGSHVWSPNIVLDRRIPMHLADGYSFAVFGQTNHINQNGGILMVVKDANLLSANGRKNTVFSFDLSAITIPEYWRAVSHYIIQVSYGKVSYVKNFLIWMQERKAANGEDVRIIDNQDLYFYRCTVAKRQSLGKARTLTIQELRRFLRWAESEGYVSVMPGAMDELTGFEGSNSVNPNPLGKTDLERLLDGLHRKGEERFRFRLSEALCRLLLYKDIRPGQLCAMTLSRLVEGPDGLLCDWSKSKNGGFSPEMRVYENKFSDVLREVIELTEPIRQKCPKGSYEDHVFIYPEPPCSHTPFGIMTASALERDMRIVCEELGLPPYTPGNIRDTYMTAITRFARKHGLSDIQKSVLTRHASKISTRSYVRENLEDILKQVEMINLGNI